MTDGPFALQDCQTIQKAFERGAAYSVTEESVFAMMTPILTNMRIQSAAYVYQAEEQEAISNPKGTKQKIDERSLPGSGGLHVDGINKAEFPNATPQGFPREYLGDPPPAADMRDLDKSDEDDEGFFTRMEGNWTAKPEGRKENLGDFGGFFDSKCIPCGFRLTSLGELMQAQWESDIAGIGAALEYWKKWLQEQIAQIIDLLAFWEMKDKYLDICALIKFLTEFMCVPDLQRVLSILMALMAKVSFDFGGIFDLILGLVAPLLQPFLSGLVNMLTRYIMIIVKPIECIIDAIQGMLAKLDYNVLFENIEKLDKHMSGLFGYGPKTGPKTPDPDIKLDIWGNEVLSVPTVDSSKDDERWLETDYNLMPGSDAIKRYNAERQKDVEKAAEELKALQRTRPDGSDPEAKAQYGEQLSNAKENYNNAVEERDLSEIGQMRTSISRFKKSMKGSLFTLISMLKEAAQAIEAFFQACFGELKKIMGEYLGGHGSFIELLSKKIALIQMISLIASIIPYMQRGFSCDPEEDVKIENIIPIDKSTLVWTDEEGGLHIEEDPEEMKRAIEKTVEAVGRTPQAMTEAGVPTPRFGAAPASALSPTSPLGMKQKEKGRMPASAEPGQKLKSLIEFTGDPVLDTQIARATEALVTPTKLVFKCPLQTSVTQAEQVNRWVQELDSK